MKEYTRKLLLHRLGIGGRFLVCILVAVGIAIGVSRYLSNKNYDTLEVISSVEHADTISTRYVEYKDRKSVV